MQVRPGQRGFTITELAVVFAIVALLIGGAMMTLSAQVESRNNDETMRRLNAASEAVIAFAIVNRRLPCPAIGGATGDEAFLGATCANWYGGFLPGRTLGFQPVDAQGYALDAWNNRIRYAVAQNVGCAGAINPHFVSANNLKANGISCLPTDLDICAPLDNTVACTAANRVVTAGTVAVVIFSTGKNGAIAAAQGPHDAANTDGNAAFISHTRAGTEAATGAFDDLMVWIPAGVIY